MIRGGSEPKLRVQDAIYENSLVSLALMQEIGYLEVALRNLVATRLGTLNNRIPPFDSWLEALIANQLVGNLSHFGAQVSKAKSELIRQGVQPTDTNIINELTFGFWAGLISKRARVIWPVLHPGFNSQIRSKPELLSEALQEVRILRNKIAHHHPISHWNIRKAHELILWCAGVIDLRLVEFIENDCRLPQRYF